MDSLEKLIVPGRSCGSCTLCCKLFAVPDFAKPRSVLCEHCVPGSGCSIHDRRPPICREFFCNWLLIKELGPEWQPENARMVLQSKVLYPGEHQCLAIQVDPDRPDIWRQPPYYEQIKQWAAKASLQLIGPAYLVMVEVGQRKFLVLPHRDDDLGEFEEGETLTVERRLNNGLAEFRWRR